jgi:predicted nucleic acid-binding Zn ribbon protein
MADDVDRAQVEINWEVQRARLAIRAAPRLMPTGNCQNCDEALPNTNQLFCDEDCGKDFERRERVRRMGRTA